MNYTEHYFENLLFIGEDPVNKQYLTNEEVEIIEDCVDYILHKLFRGRNDFVATIDYYNGKLGEDYLLMQKLKLSRHFTK